jgi:hypothetical protein
MYTRYYVGFALAWSALCLVGCGTGAAPEQSPPPGKAAAAPKPAGVRAVTLHVEGMTRRLGLV